MLGSDLPGSVAEDTKASSLRTAREDTPFQAGGRGRASSEDMRTSEFVEGTDDHLTISDTERYVSPESAQDQDRRRSSGEASGSWRHDLQKRRRQKGSHASMSSSAPRSSSADSSVGKPYVKLAQVTSAMAISELYLESHRPLSSGM